MKFLKILLLAVIVLTQCAWGTWFNWLGGIWGNWQGSGYVFNHIVTYSGLTFYKNFTDLTHNIDADFALGSPTATFTATRSASAPATYIDNQGIINLQTSSNVPRMVQGYYDTTGFHSKVGLMIEAAATNTLTRTDGTVFASSTYGTYWTGWSFDITITGTPITSNPTIPDLINISGSTSQRVQYTGVAGDSGGKAAAISSNNTAVGTFVQNDVVTDSVWVRSLTGNNGWTPKVYLIFRDSSGTLTEEFIDNITPTTYWKRYSFTHTVTTATTSRANIKVGADTGLIGTGNTVDIEVAGPQLEKNPYATSWIPTTTTSLTRGAEVLTYPISGNRTATSESIFIKFAPESVFANDSINRYLSDTDTKSRNILKSATSTQISTSPNSTDNPTVFSGSTTVEAANTSYVSTGVYQHSSPYSNTYINGTSEGTYTLGDWTDPAWGNNFYIGSRNSSITQLNGIIQYVGIYNNALSSTDVSAISTIMNAN